MISLTYFILTTIAELLGTYSQTSIYHRSDTSMQQFFLQAS